MPGAELNDDQKILFDVVREAGSLALGLAKKTVRKWQKPDGSTVTEADLQIDALLKHHLRGARPDYGWLSEESEDTQDRLARKRLWIADPIDGTNSFVNGTDGWCIGVALVEDGAPILAALFRPVADEFFWAVAGGGAYCNNELLAPRDGSNLINTELLGTGKAARILAPTGVQGMVAPHIPLLLRLAYIASGRSDIALSFGNKNDWDLAAGDLLVREAGAIVTDLEGKPYIYNRPQPWQNGMLAAGRNRHVAVLKQLEAL